jgi:rod shape-determining protein MreC
VSRLDPSGSPHLIGQEGMQTARLMVYLLLSIILLAMDQRGQYVARVRGAFTVMVEPVLHLVQWPANAVRYVGARASSFEDLLARNQVLQERLVQQSGAMQRLAALEQENKRLRALLEAGEGRQFEYRFAEMLQVDLDPFSHQVMIDQGSRDGVYEGQAVIDGAGIMGQVESVLLHMSTVRLISDPDHALPVQLNRTGLRTVAFGTGETGSLVLPSVPLQADVRAGDLLVTSGLGDRFPPGFPVALVESVNRQEGGAFARVLAQPLAALDRGREVLLILPVESAPGDGAADADEMRAGDPAPAEETP